MSKAQIAPFPPSANANTLNKLFPYMTFFLPAGAFSAGYSLPGIWHPIRIAAQEQSLDTWECPAGGQSEMFCVVDFSRLPLDVSAPSFRIRPVWLQLDDATAPDPVEYVDWNTALLNVLFGASFDRSNNANEYNILSPVLNQWIKAGGNAADVENTIPITTINGDALSAADSNTIMFEIERHSGPGYPDDTYGESAYLLGIGVQYKTDFNNIAQWLS